jgi:hypothetical protein
MLQLLGIAPDQDRVGHDARAVPQPNPALGADRENRSNQVLVRAHPAGDAVHDDAEATLAHASLLPLQSL